MGRVSYDRVWGGLLALACLMPQRLDAPSHLWDLLPAESSLGVAGWLVLAPVAALFALTAGVLGWRSRWRHFLNFAFGCTLLAFPLVYPGVWERFPTANPARLPAGDLGAIGWVVALALTAIYAGSGIRIVRPSQVAGQALAALGAFLLGIFAFLPMEASVDAYAILRLKEMTDLGEKWRELAPFLLCFLAAVCGTLNLGRSKWEVPVAKLTRVLLVVAVLFNVIMPFLEGGGGLKDHVPAAWGGLRVVAPLFLALDGCIAFVAISLTRSSE